MKPSVAPPEADANTTAVCPVQSEESDHAQDANGCGDELVDGS
jgi:hypothetical protein